MVFFPLLCLSATNLVVGWTVNTYYCHYYHIILVLGVISILVHIGPAFSTVCEQLTTRTARRNVEDPSCSLQSFRVAVLKTQNCHRLQNTDEDLDPRGCLTPELPPPPDRYHHLYK